MAFVPFFTDLKKTGKAVSVGYIIMLCTDLLVSTRNIANYAQRLNSRKLVRYLITLQTYHI